MNIHDICIYCYESGCSTDTVRHAKNCPMVTNVYPVTSADADNLLNCAACRSYFDRGDRYTTRRLHENDEDVMVIVCLTCAAFDRDIP